MTAPEPSHHEIIVAGLQRQLDELRLMLIQGDSSAQPSTQADEATRRLQSEIERQQVRIVHLLRALDDKDRTIAQLQGTDEGSGRRVGQ
ncbi:hypothetical protein IWW54_004521 [Coemansia sp. RSA 2705]|nr:hypothetical protein IWW54_004521 [Coemansia sp. RSA 2705]